MYQTLNGSEQDISLDSEATKNFLCGRKEILSECLQLERLSANYMQMLYYSLKNRSGRIKKVTG